MRLSQLRRSWTTLSESEKIEIIERTNERRLEAFEIKKQKKTKSKKKKSSKRKRSGRKRAPKTPEGLMALMKDMTPEERKNFQLMIQMQGK